MDSVVLPRIGKAVRSVTGSLGQGPNSEVQNIDNRDFSGNMEGTTLIRVSRRTGLNINHNGYYETQNSVNIEDGFFSVLKSSYDRHTSQKP